ncbi:MAG: hypothetical protein ACYCZQ_05730 [Burkholderiales bacterium]
MKFNLAFAVLLVCAVAHHAYALESLGWKGIVSGCGINYYWIVGNFYRANDVADACAQAGEDHAKRPGGGKLTVHGTKGTLKDSAHARCYFGPNEGLCGSILASPVCPAGADYVLEAEACFCGWTSKESNGKCVPGADCDEMVRRLKQLKIAQDDPRHGFYRNQTCIAEKSCAARSDMDDKQWLNKAVPAFVNPLLGKSGEWPQKMRDCKNLSKAPLGGFICQGLMADYHIEVDLQNALNKNGCGTSKDWKKVGDIITECIQQGNAEDVINKFQKAADYIANQMVQSSRDTIRANCKKLNKS